MITDMSEDLHTVATTFIVQFETDEENEVEMRDILVQRFETMAAEWGYEIETYTNDLPSRLFDPPAAA